MTGIESALARNRAFAAAGGHEGASLFPSRRLLVITCLDARVDPAHILGLELGDALVMREYAILDPATTVASDVDVLRSAAAISPRITFSGHVYDVTTGLVETVVPVRADS